jgi:hypothetical protein
MYIKIENELPTGEKIQEADFLSLFPNTSFVLPITPDAIESFGYGIVQFTLAPYVGKYQKLEEDTLQKDPSSGYWIQTWKLTEMSQPEKDVVDANKAAEVRAERNAKLVESDWTQVADSPVDKELWATYRQSLRDITSQSGFPWEIIWPQTP